MKTLVITLAAAMTFALTGCGSTSTNSLVPTYVARAQANDNAPMLYTIDPSSLKSTAVAISIPTDAAYVSANYKATEVTYCRNGNNGYDIFLMGTDNTEHQLTTGADACEAAFSPDGSTIVYASYPSGGNEGIYTMHSDGSNQTALFAPGGIGVYDPQFSPDGKSIVFLLESGPHAASVSKHSHGAGPWQLQQEARASKAGIAPQGDTTFQTGWYTMALTATTPTMAYATDEWWGAATFSADGSQILFTNYDSTNECDNIFSVSPSGGASTAVTTSNGVDDFSPVAVGGSIFFNREDSSSSSWDVWVMDKSGANQKLVSSTANVYEGLNDTYWED